MSLAHLLAIEGLSGAGKSVALQVAWPTGGFSAANRVKD
jgi:RNase adaptor protein for sRNA GlmZ degradation